MNSGFPEQTTPSLLTKCRNLLFGKSLDPRKVETQKNMVLVAFLAWIGLGADGLSSACYGPEITFLALGSHSHLAVYLAVAIFFTVFIISLGYNQVIELFPSGGGGYKVATQLIGPYTGLTSGVALIVDYVLTISISIASSVDALFSMLPLNMQSWKLTAEIVLLTILGILNLRGTKESIKVLMPIFLTFFISHFLLIVYGFLIKSNEFPGLILDTFDETIQLSNELGWVFILAILLRAYSLGGATYTGIEAVSNNVNKLAPPRVATGKSTMLLMALSLAFTAGGITLLYLLWNVSPVRGQTLNAVTFKTIMQGWVWNDIDFSLIFFLIVMISEAGLLYVAANTGYIGGPNVLSNMAADSWVPTRFRHLSSRLVTQNGILLMGFSALLILLWTKGQVQLLVIMYSINVFLTFSLSFFGLSLHRIKTRTPKRTWILKLSISGLGFIVTFSILLLTIYEKFTEGGWVTLAITGFVIYGCIKIKEHYTDFSLAMETASEQFIKTEIIPHPNALLPLDPEKPTAIFLVGEHLGVAMYTLKKVLTLFPNQYQNFVFISTVPIDSQNFGHEEGIGTQGEIKRLSQKTSHRLSVLVNYCHSLNLPANHFLTSDIDIIEGLTRLAKQKSERYPKSVFFAAKLIFQNDNWLNHWLHNHTSNLIQQRLQSLGMYMMLLPIHLAFQDPSGAELDN